MKHFIYSCFLVLFVTTFLSAQTPQARVVIEPVSAEDLIELGLTTNSVSAGVPVFANKTYIYLSAKEVGAKQPVLTSVFNLFERPATSTAVLEDLGIANWKGLKADIKGTYKIEITITTATGTDMDTLAVYAGDFIGVGAFDGVAAAFPSCMSCHTGQAEFDAIYTRWQATGHANTLKKAMDEWSFFSTSCLKCHSTGSDYNLVAANNGFDDVAFALGWVWVNPPAPGKWNAFKTAYPTAVKFATIGCENCHGAGSNHPAGQPGSAFASLSTYNAGVCTQCHAESQGVQYKYSTHSDVVFETTTGSNGNTNNLNDCARCHDGRVYIQFTQGLSGTMPGKIDVKTLKEANSVEVTCQTCHDPHGSTNPYNLRNSPSISDTLGNGYAYTLGGNGKICMDCHKARRDNVTYQTTNISSFWGPHHSVQTDNFLGKNAYQFSATPYLSNSHQFAISDACVTCHMTLLPDTTVTNLNKVGGHTFRLKNPDTNYELTGACTSCHGPKASFEEFEAPTDYDGDGTVEGIQSEVDGLLTQIRILLPPTGIDSISWAGIKASPDSVIFKQAYWNYQLMAYDGSRGMHNSKFTFDVLVKTLAKLGTIVPVELVSFNAEVGNNGVTLKWETASELNNRGFEVERNFSGKWATVGFVEGKGTTTEYSKYSYTDKPNTLSSVSYRLRQVDFNGQHTYSKVVNVDFGTMPTEFSLSQNYPNPFNPSTVIKFALPFDSKVQLTVYSISGEVVKTLVEGDYAAGVYEAQFSINSANGIASGIYLYSIKAVSTDGKSNFVQTKKMVLIK
jgi:hypothetical protein